jgi:hypothetical protein
MLVQGQAGILSNLNTIILTASAIIGTGMLLIKNFRDWQNEPTLEIVGVFDSLRYIPAGETIFDNYFLDIYFLRITKTRGRGAAKNCKGNLAIPGTSIRNVPTYWNHTNNKSRTVDISTTEDLVLFTTAEASNKIFFPSAIISPSDPVPGGENEQYLEEFLNKELEVSLDSETGRFLQKKPYRKKIADMIKESKRER